MDSNRGSTVLKPGTRWFGKCWHFQDLKKYEFDFEFDIPETYPMTAPEIALPELDGKTDKIHRGGKIYMTEHFQTLWRRNAPRFGIAHAMALGLGPWLEIPEMIEKGVVTYTGKNVICFGQIKLFFGIDTLLLTELQQKRRQSCFLKVFFFFPIFVFFSSSLVMHLF